MIQKLRQWQEIKKYHVLIEQAWVLRILVCEDTKEAVVLGYGSLNSQFSKGDEYILDYNVSEGWHGMLQENGGRTVTAYFPTREDTGYKVLNQRHIFSYKDF